MDFRRPVVIERDPAAAVPGTGSNASNSNSNSNSQPANASGATAAPLASDSVAPSGESALREEAKMLALKKQRDLERMQEQLHEQQRRQEQEEAERLQRQEQELAERRRRESEEQRLAQEEARRRAMDQVRGHGHDLLIVTSMLRKRWLQSPDGDAVGARMGCCVCVWCVCVVWFGR